MQNLKQLLHEELDNIFDELSKRVDINNTILYLEIVADKDETNETYSNVVVNAELQPDATGKWSITARDWAKDVIDRETDRDLSREHGEW
jgi:hypothetical protein